MNNFISERAFKFSNNFVAVDEKLNNTFETSPAKSQIPYEINASSAIRKKVSATKVRTRYSSEKIFGNSSFAFETFNHERQ